MRLIKNKTAVLIAMKPTVQIDLDSSIGKFMDLMG